ncbi:conserved hypothetical protein [Ricinus communis]|uniref:Uncharacterized protein n=1 Tax=Ricinus communis TaxID=3988 RepID=B9RAE9_RICCO|nr:conserved hypothetical protein [Ricinus communis]
MPLRLGWIPRGDAKPCCPSMVTKEQEMFKRFHFKFTQSADRTVYQIGQKDQRSSRNSISDALP